MAESRESVGGGRNRPSHLDLYNEMREELRKMREEMERKDKENEDRRNLEATERKMLEENERRERKREERRDRERHERNVRSSYYHPRREHRERQEPKGEQMLEVKIELPFFKGLNNPKAYLEWEKEVYQIFKCHHLHEERKISLASFALEGEAKRWWGQIQTDIVRQRRAPIHTWIEMKKSLREGLGPPFYTHEHYKKFDDYLERKYSTKGTNHSRTLRDEDMFKKEGSPSPKLQVSKSLYGKYGSKDYIDSISPLKSSTTVDEYVTKPSMTSIPSIHKSMKCFKCLAKGHIALDCPCKASRAVEHNVVDIKDSSSIHSSCTSIPHDIEINTQIVREKEVIEKQLREKMEKMEKELRKEIENRKNALREEIGKREKKLREEIEEKEKQWREKESKEKELRMREFMEKYMREKKEKKEKELREKELKEREVVEKQENEKYSPLNIVSNPLFICEHLVFEGDEEMSQRKDFPILTSNPLFKEEKGIAHAPFYKNPFELMPKDDLLIKEPLK